MSLDGDTRKALDEHSEFIVFINMAEIYPTREVSNLLRVSKHITFTLSEFKKLSTITKLGSWRLKLLSESVR